MGGAGRGTAVVRVVGAVRPERTIAQVSGGTAAVDGAALAVLAGVLGGAAVATAVPILWSWTDYRVLLAALVGASIALAGGTWWLVRRERARRDRVDALTGVMSLAAFEAAVAARGGTGALVVVGLGRFAAATAGLSPQARDRVLAGIGPALAGCLRRSDLLARAGEREFAVLLAGADATVAAAVAERLVAAVAGGARIDDLAVDLGPAAGVVPLPEETTAVTTALAQARVALRTAHDAGGGVRAYVPAADPAAASRLHLLADLRRAFAAEELVLHYQPKADLPDGTVRGLEALIRWEHPRRGLLTPDAFLPLIDEAGLAPALTHRVLELAARQTARWHAVGLPVSVAVNIGPPVLVDPGLPARVERLLAAHGLPACALQVEVTEHLVAADRGRAAPVLTRLRALGIEVAVDDFGTGYSALAALRDLPVTELKLDRRFVTSLGTDRDAAVIVRSTIEMAHGLDLRVVAEGVEDTAAWNLLVAFGADAVQGYYLSPPRSAADVTRWMHARQAAAGQTSGIHAVPA